MALKRILSAVSFLLASSGAIAQGQQADTLRNLPMVQALTSLRNNWLQSPNAAGMKLSSFLPAGKTELSYNNLSGGMKLAQQPESCERFQFNSERYQPLGGAIFYGSFSYTEQRDKNVRFSDVMNPYRGTPYLLADSIGGDWKKQLYSLKLKVSSPQLLGDKLILGIGAELNVGTGARQNDPRPLNTSNEINITPGLIWKLSDNSHIGINGLYGRYREEISLEVKNTYVNHYLYKFLGIGQYELPGVFSVGSARNYDGNKYGGDLQYELTKGRVSWLTTAGYRSYSEEVSDGNSVPRKAGTWKQKEYNVLSVFNLHKGRVLQQFKLNGQLTEDTGIEFHEYFNTVTKEWQTILEAPFYTAETKLAGLSYTYLKESDQMVYSWLAEVGLNYQSVDKQYTIPVSAERLERIAFYLKGGKNMLTGKNSSLQVSLSLGYSMSLSDGVSFIPVTSDRTLLAREILYPDHAYLSADRLIATAEAQYNFNIRKVKGAKFFIGSVANVIRSVNADAVYPAASGNRRYVSLSLGAYY